MTLPAVLLVLAMGIVGVGAASKTVALQDAAADAARLVSRGEDPEPVRSAIARTVPGVVFAIEHEGELVCVEVRASVGLGPVVDALPIGGRSCALADGR